MTCRKADELMECALNGELDDDDDGLHHHLSHCERCADAWHTAWQVRSIYGEENGHDPGEAYFEQATARIMERVAAIAAQTARAEEAPVVSSMRHGPLGVRGVGVLFVLALTFLGETLFSSHSAAQPTIPLRPKSNISTLPSVEQLLPPVDSAYAGLHTTKAPQALHRALHGPRCNRMLMPTVPTVTIDPARPLPSLVGPPPLPQMP